MVIQPDIGLDIDVPGFRFKAAPGEVVVIGKGLFEEFIEPHFPVAVLQEPRLKWKEEFDNLVVTEGRNALLEDLLKGNAPSAGTTWYVGLKDTGTPAAADTMGSHASWAEIAPYSDANRPTFTPGTVASGSVDNSASKAVFNINATDDVYGAFLSNENTKSGTDGKLYGAGDFSSARSVQDGDTLNVTVTCTVTAS
jgi:hypothetical protein